MDGGNAPLATHRSRNSLRIEGLGHLHDCAAPEHHVKDAAHDGIRRWIELQPRALLGTVLNVDSSIPERRMRGHPEPSGCRLSHSSRNLLARFSE